MPPRMPMMMTDLVLGCQNFCHAACASDIIGSPQLIRTALTLNRTGST